MNNDYQTAKDVTVRAHCDSRKAQELLILLDESMARALMMNPKSATKQQEKAMNEAEKRINQFERLQKKSLKKAEKEEKHLEKTRSKLIVTPMNGQNSNGVNNIPTTNSSKEQSTSAQIGSHYTNANTKKVGKLFQTNTSSRNNLIKSLSNISHPQIYQQSGQVDNTSYQGIDYGISGTGLVPGDEDGLEVIQGKQPPKDVNVRGIMSEVLKNNRSKSNGTSMDV